MLAEAAAAVAAYLCTWIICIMCNKCMVVLYILSRSLNGMHLVSRSSDDETLAVRYAEHEQKQEQAIYKQNSGSSSMVAFSFCLDEHDHLSQSWFDHFIPFGEAPRPDSMRFDKEKVRRPTYS